MSYHTAQEQQGISVEVSLDAAQACVDTPQRFVSCRVRNHGLSACIHSLLDCMHSHHLSDSYMHQTDCVHNNQRYSPAQQT